LTALRYAAILLLEVVDMIRLTIRVSEELHEKLRWLAYKERRSQQVLLEELLEKALADVQVPKEASE
jgi:predicted transcriptional regulator